MSKKDFKKFDSVGKPNVETKDKIKQSVKVMSYEEVRRVFKKVQPRIDKYLRELS